MLQLVAMVDVQAATIHSQSFNKFNSDSIGNFLGRIVEDDNALTLVGVASSDSSGWLSTSTLSPDFGSIVPSNSSYTVEGLVSAEQIDGLTVQISIERLDNDPRLFWNGSNWQASAENIFQAATVTAESWSLSGVDLSEIGEYKIQIFAVDDQGNQTDPSSDTTEFTVTSADTTAPEISVGNPVNASTVLSNISYTVQGAVTDDISGIQSVDVSIRRLGVSPELFWDGTTWQASPVDIFLTATVNNEEWSLAGVDLSVSGQYQAQLIARDFAGNETDTSENTLLFSVSSLDTTAPNVSIISPANGSTTEANLSYTLQGTVTDHESGVQSVLVRIFRRDVDSRLYWNGETWQTSPANVYQTTILSDDEWSLPGVDLSENGQYRLQLLARDVAGNQTNPSSDIVAFTVSRPDTNAPNISIINPANRSKINPDSFYKLTGLATDDVSGVQIIRVRIYRRDANQRVYWNGETWQESPANTYQTATLNNDEWSLAGIDLSKEGQYRIQLLAQDFAGNKTDPATDIVSFSVDDSTDISAPIISVTNPTNRSATDSDSFYTVQGTVTDEESGVQIVRIRIFRQDTDPRLYWNGETWQESPSNTYQTATVNNDDWSLSGVDLSGIGQYRIQLLARDFSGNQTNPAAETFIFSVSGSDTTPPQVAAIVPVRRSVVSPDPAFTIQGIVSDVESDVHSVRVRIERRDVEPRLFWNGFTWQPSTVGAYQSATIVNNDWSLSGVDLTQPGDYRVQILARDVPGNQTSPSANMTYFSVGDFDVTVPKVTVTNPDGDTTISSDQSFTLVGAVTDAGSGVLEVLVRLERLDVDPRLYWNGSNWHPSPSGSYQEATVINNDWNLSGVDLSQDGEYHVQIIARDNVGNQSDPNASAVQFSVGSLEDCYSTHVYLLAGQSNANGQAGYFFDETENLPGRRLSGENSVYAEPYDNICYAYRRVNRSTWTVDYDYGFGPLEVRYIGSESEPYFSLGTEVSLGRMLDGSARNPNWPMEDKVCLLKFAAGGTAISSWHPDDQEGLHSLFLEFLDEKINELKQTECKLKFEDLFWVQGEGDTGNLAKVESYVEKFQDFIASFSTTYPFRPVFSQIKSPNSMQSPNRAIYTPLLNQKMRNAGYLTTIDNNDLVFIDQNSINPSSVNQHYDAASYIELGNRLAQTSAEN